MAVDVLHRPVPRSARGRRRGVRRPLAAPSRTGPPRSGRSCARWPSAGHEIALHGIDAWRNTERRASPSWRLSRGLRGPASAVCGCTGCTSTAARSQRWTQPGSTTTRPGATTRRSGFRAGTSQVFAPLGAAHLLELPLQIQDTSLLYPGRMHCRESEAVALGKQHPRRRAPAPGASRRSPGMSEASRRSGCGTGPYRELLAVLRARGASVRPAREIVAWFRAPARHRSRGRRPDLRVRVADLPTATGADALRVRIHHRSSETTAASSGCTDLAVAAGDLAAVARGDRLVRS